MQLNETMFYFYFQAAKGCLKEKFTRRAGVQP